MVKIKYMVAIGFVDGQISCQQMSESAKEALEFLERYDHEGSAIKLEMEVENPEDIYEFLRQRELKNE